MLRALNGGLIYARHDSYATTRLGGLRQRLATVHCFNCFGNICALSEAVANDHLHLSHVPLQDLGIHPRKVRGKLVRISYVKVLTVLMCFSK